MFRPGRPREIKTAVPSCQVLIWENEPALTADDDFTGKEEKMRLKSEHPVGSARPSLKRPAVYPETTERG